LDVVDRLPWWAAAVFGVAFVNRIANVRNFLSPNVKTLADLNYASPVARLILLSGVVLLAGLLFLGLRVPKPVGTRTVRTA